MDLKTGRVYDDYEAAVRAGVNPADLIAVERAPDGSYRLPSKEVVRVLGGSEQLPHQGKREMARRAKRLSEQLERELREAREDLK